MSKITDVMIFDNLNIAVFDGKGEQIPELQHSLISLWADHAERKGYDAEGLVVKTPRGNWRLFKTEGGWNYEQV